MTAVRITAMLTVAAIPAAAQYSRPFYDNEIRVISGTYSATGHTDPFDKSAYYCEALFTKYYDANLGFRTGFRYVDDDLGISYFYGLPLNVVYGTGKKFGQDVSIMEGESFGESLFIFFLSLINSAEVSAGLTPGYLEKLSYGTRDDYYHYLGRVKGQFGITADVGLGLGLVIGRIGIRGDIGYHHNLIRNYGVAVTDLRTGSISTRKTPAGRFSAGLGVSFRF